MNVITRYVMQNLAGPLLILAFTFAGVAWLTQGLRFFDMIVNMGLSAGMFLYLSLLLLPTALVYILPISLFFAVLFGYNRLNGDGELVVMRAAGLNTRTLAAPALILALIVTLVLYGITLYLKPASMRTFKGLQFAMRYDFASVILREGVFNNLADGVTVYVRERSVGGELLGILVHDSRAPDRLVTMMAERGVLARAEGGPRFVLVKGNRQEVAADSGQLSMLYFDRYVVDLEQDVVAPEDRWLEAGERYMHELLFPEGPAEAVRLYGREFAPEVHSRIITPLQSIAFVLIGLAAVLSGEFDRRGQWRRIGAAVVGALIVQALGLVFASMAAERPALISLMYLNLVAPIGLSIYLLSRPTTRRALA